MQRRVLGRSGIEVSGLGLGCINLGGPWARAHRGGEVFYPGDVDQSEVIRAIHCALDLGIDFFDTAANYGAGRGERVLGQALAARRSEAVISTKFGYFVDEANKLTDFYDQNEERGDIASHLRQDCEASLGRLCTDTIDLYLFHVNGYAPDKAAEVRDVLEDLVTEGKIRAYGWSTNNPEGARVFAEGKHCAAIEHHMHLMADAPEILDVCEVFGLASITYSPLAAGLLSGKYRNGYAFSPNDRRSTAQYQNHWVTPILDRIDDLRDVLTGDGRSLVQGALGWIWARSGRTIPIPGFRTVKQVEENAAALDFGPLSAKQMCDISEILGRTGMGD